MKLIIIVCLSVSVSVLGQNLLINGDFESGTGGWTKWWNSSNAGFPVSDPVEGDNCAGVWWSDVGIYQRLSIGPGLYTVSGQMLHTSAAPLGNNRIGIIQAEVGNGTQIWWKQQIVIDQTSPRDKWIDGQLIVDNRTAGASSLNINLFMYDRDGEHTGNGIVRYDNLSVTPEAAVNDPDYNDDKAVNLLDFSEFSGQWALESLSCNLSGPAVIDMDDLAVFAEAWLMDTPTYPGYELVWSDEFSGSSLNLADWEYMIGDGCSYGVCGWGNNELEYYRAENVSVQNGMLIIEARRENYGGKQFTSGRLRTANKRDFLYGRMEARIKVPTGGGMWPAFWMMPTDSVYGGWAASGEIDIMETRNSTNFIQGTIFYGGGWPNQQSSTGKYEPAGVDFSQDFHVYTLEWEPDIMRWYVDGILYSTKTSSQWYSDGAPGNNRAPFDQRFHLLLNTAVGGNYTGCTSASCITAVFPQQMLVDWVRVYQKTAP